MECRCEKARRWADGEELQAQVRLGECKACSIDWWEKG